jgi:hypothetical protein
MVISRNVSAPPSKLAFASTTLDDFVRVYPHALAAADCNAIIAAFEESGEARYGETGTGLDRTMKDSMDITLAGTQWRPTQVTVVRSALACR